MREVLELALLLHVFRLYRIQIRESQEKSSRPLAKMFGKANLLGRGIAIGLTVCRLNCNT